MRELSRSLDGRGDRGSLPVVLHELNRLAIRLGGGPVDAADEAELAIRLEQLEGEVARGLLRGEDLVTMSAVIDGYGAALGGLRAFVDELLTARGPSIDRRRATLGAEC